MPDAHGITPSPPQRPANQVDGTWDVNMSCPGGSALRESGAHFTLGRYARDFQIVKYLDKPS